MRCEAITITLTLWMHQNQNWRPIKLYCPIKNWRKIKHLRMLVLPLVNFTKINSMVNEQVRIVPRMMLYQVSDKTTIFMEVKQVSFSTLFDENFFVWIHQNNQIKWTATKIDLCCLQVVIISIMWVNCDSLVSKKIKNPTNSQKPKVKVIVQNWQKVGQEKVFFDWVT